MFIRLPDWHQVNDKSRGRRRLTAIEYFVLEYEPFMTEGLSKVNAWRQHLRDALEEAMRHEPAHVAEDPKVAQAVNAAADQLTR